MHSPVLHAGSPHSTLLVWPTPEAGLTQPGVWGSAGLDSRSRGYTFKHMIYERIETAYAVAVPVETNIRDGMKCGQQAR